MDDVRCFTTLNSKVSSLTAALSRGQKILAVTGGEETMARTQRFLLLASLLAAATTPAFGQGGVPPTSAPDFSGQWGRYFSFAFEPPASGPGPVRNIAGLPRADVGLRVGDYKNPILKPKAADVVKKRGEMELTGASFPDPRNQCRPEPPPFILGLEFEIQILQREDK